MSDTVTVEQVEQVDNIQELRAIAKGLDLSGAGSKDALRARIGEHLSAAPADQQEPETAPAVAPVPDAPSGESVPEIVAVSVTVEPAVSHPDDTPEDGARPIRRVGQNKAWWCPFCDHSNHDSLTECGGCRARREDGVVYR